MLNLIRSILTLIIPTVTTTPAGEHESFTYDKLRCTTRSGMVGTAVD